MHMIMYTSAASHPFSENELIGLLDICRTNNKKQQISGMLLYHNNSFMQVIEGEKKTIYDLFNNKLSFDPRHRALTLILDKPIEHRYFPNWTMGFKNLVDFDVSKFPEYSDFLTSGQFTDSPVSENPTIAHRFLQQFRESNW